MNKPQFEKCTETAYICEQCGTAHLRHRLTLVDGTVAREKYWAADRLSCCGESMKLRVITFNMLEPTKCHTCSNPSCPYPTDGEFGVQWAKGGKAWQENKDCWIPFDEKAKICPCAIPAMPAGLKCKTAYCCALCPEPCNSKQPCRKEKLTCLKTT